MKIANVILASLAILATAGMADGLDYDAWDKAPLGIAITNVVYDTFGVSVLFDTDLEPPYIVGVYDAFEAGLDRRFPIAEVTTRGKSAFVKGDFTDTTTFVEVMLPSRFDKRLHRVMSADERKRMHEFMRQHPVYKNSTDSDYKQHDAAWAPGNIMGQQKGLELIGDNLWIGFFFSNDPQPSIGLRTMKSYPVMCTQRRYNTLTTVYSKKTSTPFPPTSWDMISEGVTSDWFGDGHPAPEHREIMGPFYTDRYGNSQLGEPGVVPNKYTGSYEWKMYHVRYEPTEYTREVLDRFDLHEEQFDGGSLTFPSNEMNRGLGWRVIVDDRTMETLCSRAFSARPNCSQTVYLPRAFIGLSAHDGYRLTIDAIGRVIAIPDSNEHVIEVK